MNRRKVLGLMGSLPMVGPKLAAKIQSDQAIGQLMGMPSVQGFSCGQSVPGVYLNMAEDPGQLNMRKFALKLPWVKNELEAMVREENHHVWGLDPDLAVLKAVSMNVKICIQRQRNVEKALAKYGCETSWNRANSIFERAKSLYDAFVGRNQSTEGQARSGIGPA